MKEFRTYRTLSAGLAVLSLILAPSLTPLGASELYGFRADGQNRFPDAEPVLEWGPDKNVIWKTPMPSWSNACPVICGDRIFVCSEPTTIVCVNLADGKILWQKSNDYADLVKDPAEQEKIKEQIRKAGELRQEIDKKNHEINKIDKDIKDKKGDEETLKKQIAEIRKSIEPIQKELNGLTLAIPPAHPTNGYSSATPFTDGKSVWAAFGTGVVACYDKEGVFKWGRRIENPPNGWGSCISPILADNILAVQYDSLYGLDPETGKEIWKLKTPWGWGSPSVTKIGGKTVILTSQGSIVDVKDGREIAKNLKKLQYNSMLLQDGVMYFIEEKPVAYKVPATDDGKVEKLWDGEDMHKERYYASPLLHEGLIYAIDQARFFTVIDASNGKKVYEKKVEFLKACTYPSPVLAGKHILLGSEDGKTLIIEPGREYKEVATNTLEPSRSTPIFVGNRMIVRTLKTLYCIGK